jgi:hypothetical protein
VEKQRRLPSKLASGAGQVDMGAVWNGANGEDEAIQAGHFEIKIPKERLPLAAAAPGLQ